MRACWRETDGSANLMVFPGSRPSVTSVCSVKRGRPGMTRSNPAPPGDARDGACRSGCDRACRAISFGKLLGRLTLPAKRIDVDRVRLVVDRFGRVAPLVEGDPDLQSGKTPGPPERRDRCHLSGGRTRPD